MKWMLIYELCILKTQPLLIPLSHHTVMSHADTNERLKVTWLMVSTLSGLENQ